MRAATKFKTHPGIDSLIPYQPGKSIEELQHEKGLSHIIKLASNENPLGCSSLALQAIHAISSTTVASYPAPKHHPLLPNLAATLNCTVDQLFLSNGSDFIFSLLLNCFALHQNKHIVIHDYAFSTYAIQAQVLNIPVHSVAVNRNWNVNIDNLIQACNAHTALLFIANPNNPTGLFIEPQQILYLLDNIPRTTLVVLDEAYYEFAQFSAPSHYNTIDWLDLYPNLIVTRTFSKIYGLAGLRIGYAVANCEIINLLYKIQLPFILNQTALNAAQAALQDQAFVRQSLDSNAQGMLQISQALQKLKLTYFDSYGNFICFNCGEDSLKLYNYLLDRGIILRPLHPYKMEQFLRVSIGTDEQNQRFIEQLNNYYKGQH